MNSSPIGAGRGTSGPHPVPTGPTLNSVLTFGLLLDLFFITREEILVGDVSTLN